MTGFPLRRLAVMLIAIFEIGCLGLIGWAGDWLARALAWPLPGSVLGLCLLLALLASGVMPARAFRSGAELLMSNLLLFFVPPMLALVERPELLSATGAKLVAAVLIGTVVVMGGTALAVELSLRRDAHAA